VQVPPSRTAKLTAFALNDLSKKMHPANAAALVEAFGRRAVTKHRDREDEPLPVGKGKMLGSIRITVDGNEYRLIYGRVGQDKRLKPAAEPGTGGESGTPIRFVGLLAWSNGELFRMEAVHEVFFFAAS
jgi:hypothetical protein